MTGVRTYALCIGQKGIKWLIATMFLVRVAPNKHDEPSDCVLFFKFQFVVVIGSFVLYEISTKCTSACSVLHPLGFLIILAFLVTKSPL